MEPRNGKMCGCDRAMLSDMFSAMLQGVTSKCRADSTVASYIPMDMIIELSRQHDKNLLVEQKMPVLPFLNDL